MKPKCLIGCSGSVASLKVPELVAELSPHFEIMILCTQNACFFLERAENYNPESWKKFELAGGWHLVLKDEDEWQMWNSIGHSVLHIEVRRWADVFIVAPASANVLSKASQGVCDNFVLSVMRAWDFTKPCVLCPAMNTAMWNHPTTVESLRRLQQWGWDVLNPVEKMLACKEKGKGAMVSVEAIRDFLLEKDLAQRVDGAESNNVTSNTTVDAQELSADASNTTIAYNGNDSYSVSKGRFAAIDGGGADASASVSSQQGNKNGGASIAGMALGSFMLGLGVGVGVVAGLVALEIYVNGKPFNPRDIILSMKLPPDTKLKG